MTSIKFFLCLLTTIVFPVFIQAQENYVDLRPTGISGKIIEVPAPNVLKIKTKKDGQYKTFFVEIIHVDFAYHKNIDCKSRKVASYLKRKNHTYSINDSILPISNPCTKMKKWLKGKNVRIEITQWSQPITKGYVFLGSTNVNHELVSRGWYRVDYKQSRDASLVLLEKNARCQRVGIWKQMIGIPEEDMKCQD